MDLKKSKPQKHVFVIMPFVKTPTRNQEHLSGFFENNIKRPIEEATLDSEYKVWRSGETFNITDEIIRDLFKADIVIADLSGLDPNPNVMYELGVRLALSDKPVILIREKNPDNKKVFDVDSYYIHQYDPFSYPELEKHLIEKLRRFETNEEQFESPVKKVLHDQLILSQSTLDSLSPIQQKEILIRGAKLVSKSISASFGPLGQGIPIKDKSGNQLLAKRGFDISRSAWSSNPLENKAIDLLTQASRNMLEKVGDGSKLAILLTVGMIEAGIEALKQNYLPRNIIRGLELAIHETCSYIDKNTFFLKNQEEVASVAAVAGKSKSIGSIIADCLNKVGKFGIVTFEKGDSKDTEIEIIEGIHFDRGYISSDFIAQPDVEYWKFEDCLLLLYPKVISSHYEILLLLDKIAITKKPLLIIATDVTDTALDTILLNVQKGTIECVAVKMPGFGDRSMDRLEDIAVTTGGKIISSLHGFELSNIGIRELGTAKEIIVTKDYKRIIGGGGKRSELKARVNRLEKAMESCRNLYEKEKYQERLAMLVGATAIVRVGGVTYQDIEEKSYGFESALNSAMTAIAYGAVIGGGLTLLKAKKKVSKVIAGNHEEAAGVDAVLKCLDSPIKNLIQNSNLSFDDIMNDISINQDTNKGLDVEIGSIVDLENQGILDSSAVLKTALDIALSYSKLFFESSSWIDQRHKDVEV